MQAYTGVVEGLGFRVQGLGCDLHLYTLSSSAALLAHPWTMVGMAFMLICRHASCKHDYVDGFMVSE